MLKRKKMLIIGTAKLANSTAAPFFPKMILPIKANLDFKLILPPFSFCSFLDLLISLNMYLTVSIKGRKIKANPFFIPFRAFFLSLSVAFHNVFPTAAIPIPIKRKKMYRVFVIYPPKKAIAVIILFPAPLFVLV